MEGACVLLLWVVLLVNRAVSRSVNQVSSPQHLLPPSLERYQTWYRGCPERVDVPYWFSCYIWSNLFKCCPINIFWPLFLIVENSEKQCFPLKNRFPLLIFRSPNQRKRSNCCYLYKMFFDPFVWEFLNFVQCLSFYSRCSLMIFKSCTQRKRSNCWY